MTVEEIKEQYSIRDILSKYGISVNRAGFCSCPFHSGDRTPSMKIYKDSYHCFACGANGDIFSFIQKIDNCDFKTAFKSLGGTYKDCSDYQHKMYQYKLQKRKATEYKRLQRVSADKLQTLEEIKMQRLFARLCPVFSDDWCDSVNRLEYLYYKLEYLITEKRW
jgi:DNA primase